MATLVFNGQVLSVRMTEALGVLMSDSAEDLPLLVVVLEERYEDSCISGVHLTKLVDEASRAIAIRRNQISKGALGTRVTAKDSSVRESILDGLTASDDVSNALASIRRMAMEASEASQSILLVGE